VFFAAVFQAIEYIILKNFKRFQLVFYRKILAIGPFVKLFNQPFLKLRNAPFFEAVTTVNRSKVKLFAFA